MQRKRLTRRNAADDKTAYPGSVNQTRQDPDRAKYHTFEHTVNHELPDMRHEWKNDQRNDIGFGIPTVASIRSAASKAVKLAVLLLGDKVAEHVIEAQARSFMKLGPKALNASLLRFAESETLYAGEEVEEEVKAADEEVKEPVAKAPVAAVAKKAEQTDACTADQNAPNPAVPDQPVISKKAEDVPVVPAPVAAAVVAPVVPEAKPATKPVAAVAKKAEDEKVEEEVKASDDEDVAEEIEAMDELLAGDDEEEEVEASDDDEEEMEASDDEEEVKAPVAKQSKVAELDVQMSGDEMDETEMSAEDEKALASLYADDEMADDEEKPVAKKTASKGVQAKKGVKKLGGQPKIAASNVTASDSLDNLWQSAPDVSKIFE